MKKVKTKQEEIDRILTLATGKTGVHLDKVKRELSEAGVVIKVDYKYPDKKLPVCELVDPSGIDYSWKWQRHCPLIKEVGYVAVEPLVKE